MMYRRAVRRRLTGEAKEFALVPKDLRTMGCGLDDGREVASFDIEKAFEGGVGVPLKKKGAYVHLFKHKYWERLRPHDVD